MTADMVRKIEAMNGTPSRIASAPARDTTLDQRLEMLDRAGVDVQVLSVASNHPNGADANQAGDLAKEFNDTYQGVVDTYGGRFAAFGCVPLPHVDAALAEARRCLDDLGFAGITLGCSVQRQPLDQPAFEPFWAELDRRKTVVFLHPMGIGAPMADDYNLTWLIGAPFEDTVTALRLVASGLTSRHPGVRIIIPHLGGTVPYVWSRLNYQIADSGESLKHGLRDLYYDTVNLAPGMLCAACGLLDASHIMLGTDFPYVMPDKYGEFVTSVQESGLPSDAVSAILDHNAQELLRLPAKR